MSQGSIFGKDLTRTSLGTLQTQTSHGIVETKNLGTTGNQAPAHLPREGSYQLA